MRLILSGNSGGIGLLTGLTPIFSYPERGIDAPAGRYLCMFYLIINALPTLNLSG